jgi:hypothetical protein
MNRKERVGEAMNQPFEKPAKSRKTHAILMLTHQPIRTLVLKTISEEFPIPTAITACNPFKNPKPY